MSRQWRDPKTKGTALSKGSARGRKDLGEKATITNKNRALVFGNCHLALAGCTKDGIQAILPCPIFETGITASKTKSVINVGKQQVDVATDFLNQPDQWCQAFNFTYSHLLKVKQQPSPLEFIECMLFISRDRAYDTLMRACETALLELERSELRLFNEMLISWDNAKVRAAASSPQAKEKALKDGSLDTEEKKQLQWMEDIVRKAKKRVEHFANEKLEPLKVKPSTFAPFLSYRSKNELFQIEAGVILGANPIAHLRKHPYGWLYYGKFLKSIFDIMHGQVFKDYGGIEEAVKNQISYLENDLDIKDSGLTSDKFIEKLNLMEIALRAFPLGHCNELEKDNRIPNAKKKRITFNACREKYKKQLEARSKLTESAFTSWADMQEVFVECHRAFAEEEKEKKSNKDAQGGKPPKGELRDKKRKADGSQNTSAKFCQWCKDNGRADKADTHFQSNCHILNKKLNQKNDKSNTPWKKQRVGNELNALLKKSGMSKEDAIAALSETQE